MRFVVFQRDLVHSPRACMLSRCLALLVSLGAVLILHAAPALAAGHTTVLFVGGYGSTLASVEQIFSPLRTALVQRDPSSSFAVYSYEGWNAQTCAPIDY